MRMQSIEEIICQTIDIIVNRAIEKAKFDRTILAQIIKKIEPGKYRVKYMDGIFYAYSNNEYLEGSNVYVLIPEGDFNKEKIIIGELPVKGN